MPKFVVRIYFFIGVYSCSFVVFFTANRHKWTYIKNRILCLNLWCAFIFLLASIRVHSWFFLPQMDANGHL